MTMGRYLVCKPLPSSAVFSASVSAQLIDLYSFPVSQLPTGATPEECDRIFGFGFSRGPSPYASLRALCTWGLARYDGMPRN